MELFSIRIQRTFQLVSTIHVYYDNRGDEYNNDASINLQGWGQAYAEELEKQLISHEAFNKALNDCIDLIKRRLA